MPDKERAKRVILEIVHLSGGELTGTTRLYKAFYFAHLYFAEGASGYLTDWPIVKMPNGPGIHSCEVLVAELIAEGFLQKDHVPVGPFLAVRYRATGGAPSGDPLPDPAVQAIQRAAQLVDDKSAWELTDLTHQFSRSWNSAREGEELNIYVDLIPDDEYEARQARLNQTQQLLDAAWQ